jgi:RNA polymerase sigma factor (sigma-70 family)
VLGPIQRLFGRGTVSGLSEGQLLARFVGERDELAFEAIVARHGPMVLGLCRRLLDDPDDVDDAFQATFLVLVRRAGSLRDRDLLSSWLYGVALRVASRARSRRARRRFVRPSETDLEGRAGPPPGESDLGELRTVLDAEVARLPERFRAPIVLCYFEGLTHDQAAERLRCPVGTVRSRMAKAREILRSRLVRRGFGPASLVPAAPLAGLAPAVPPSLLARTSAAAAAWAGGSWLAGGASSSAIALARGVLRAMTYTKWMTIAAAVVVLGAVGGGVRVAARPDGADATKGQPPARPPEAARSAQKVLADVQSLIHQYEVQIHQYEGQLAKSRAETAYLNARIADLEAKARARATQGPAPSPSPDTNPARPEDLKSTLTVNQAPALDRIKTCPQALVSVSGANDRVVIYGTGSGRSRTYRPPHGMTNISVTFHGDNVTIVANRPGAAHLANYNLKSDHWALQDIRGVAEGVIEVPDDRDEVHREMARFLLPCIYRGPGFTQLAVFDYERASWMVQDLVEPAQEKQASPHVIGGIALYVLGRHVYAYSAEAGRWDTLALEEPLIPGALQPGPGTSPLFMKEGMAAVSQHGRLHLFSAKTGRWETANPKD